MDAHHTGVAEGTWLAPWLSWLDAALEHEVARFRTRYGLEAGDLRALHLGDEQVDGLLAAPVHTDDPATATLDARLRRLLDSSIRAGDPLGRIAEQFELEPASIVAVVLALAPETDLAYAGVYAYLNDDATMRLATVDLCRRLTPGGGSLSSDAAVVTEGLVGVVGSVAAPLWSATGLVLSGPLRRFLLAGGAAMPSRPRARPAALPRLTLFEGEVDDDATAAAREHALMAGWCLVEPDPPGPAGNALSDAVLTARLHGAAVFVPAAYLAATADDVGSGHAADVVRSLLRAPVPLVLGIRPGWAHRLPLTGVDHEVVRVGRPDIADRTRLWWRELSAAGAAPPPEAVAEVAGLFALGPAQIRAAAVAVAREGAHDAAALLRAARAAGGAGLGAIAERVDAEPTWDDLVLPEATLRRLRELADAVRSRHRVFDSWGFGRATAGRSGVRVLLSGPSGTGKTMAASVLAHDLGLELYRIDLSAVVSKYIGETEKNLERVLSAAERSNALLLFDEADALFGKRSEVSDSHDRYANIEIAFLLQRIEAFDGVLLLATNLPGNLDDAFARRMQFHLEFPLPDRVARERLWRQAIPAAAPRADDLDPAFLAGMFPLAGGDIRSASVQAAFLAAHDDEPIGMRHLVRAVARLRRQHGKLPSAAEFKEYVKYAREDDG